MESLRLFQGNKKPASMSGFYFNYLSEFKVQPFQAPLQIPEVL